MRPVLFRFPEWVPFLGDQAVTSFGVLVALGMFAGGWVFARRMEQRGIHRDVAWDLVVFAGFGGMLGAKLWYLVLHWPDFFDDPVTALTARSGLVWYGGLLGAVVAGTWRAWSRRVPIALSFEALAPAMPVGYGIGRIGCFLVGDDYGVPTAGPFGIAFPQGAPPTTIRNLEERFGATVPPELRDREFIPVHATQLYEVALAVVTLVVLVAWERRAARRGTPLVPPALFAVWLALAGLSRFLVEFLRAKDDRLLGALSIAQAVSLALVALGVILYRAAQTKRSAPVEP